MRAGASQSARIGLVRFGEAAQGQAVSSHLARHHYSVFDVDPTHTKTIECDLLLLLAGNRIADKALITKVKNCATPRLLIVPRDCSMNPDLTRCCDDFLFWPSGGRELILRVERLLSSPARVLPSAPPTERASDFVGLGLIGRAPSFQAALHLIARLASSNVAVLIGGETGTGKEIAARALHYLGRRRDMPFVPFNCGALPDALLENELFGHRAGAYTDAKRDVEGLVTQADGGTLFFDEVDTLSSHGQVALLRFLQEREYRPLGGGTLRRSDVRILAASNTALEKLVETGRFRADLYYRLNVARVDMPPLRERAGDARALAEHFLSVAATRDRTSLRQLGLSALHWIETYSWPGNVRELESFIERQLVLADGLVIELDDDALATAARSESNGGLMPYRTARECVLRVFERDYLHGLMMRVAGNVTAAARLAQKERRAFGRLLSKHGLKGSDFRTPSAS
jgi:DNA-binding NtrC family response regulator